MSAMDAIGAKVIASCDDAKRTRIVQVGTGFSTQNAHTLTIGVGTCEKVERKKEARTVWEQALKVDPSFEAPRRNIEEMLGTI